MSSALYMLVCAVLLSVLWSNGQARPSSIEDYVDETPESAIATQDLQMDTTIPFGYYPSYRNYYPNGYYYPNNYYYPPNYYYPKNPNYYPAPYPKPSVYQDMMGLGSALFGGLGLGNRPYSSSYGYRPAVAVPASPARPIFDD